MTEQGTGIIKMNAFVNEKTQIGVVLNKEGDYVDFDLTNIDRVGAPSGMFEMTSEEKDKIFAIAKDAGDKMKAVLAEINQRIAGDS